MGDNPQKHSIAVKFGFGFFYSFFCSFFCSLFRFVKTGIERDPAEYTFMLGPLTNAVNGVLLFLVALAPLLPNPSGSGSRPAAFWARSLLGIGLGVALAEAGKHFVVWPGRPTFPSGHETLALAAGTCLVLRDRRWLVVAAPCAALQAWALVMGHFHRPADIAGALVTGLLPPLGCHLYFRSSGPKP